MDGCFDAEFAVTPRLAANVENEISGAHNESNHNASSLSRDPPPGINCIHVRINIPVVQRGHEWSMSRTGE